MDIEQIRDYCLALKGVTEETPFGPDNLVYKVMGKMFLLLPIDTLELTFNLKNTPEKNEELRADYPNIKGAFHMNKTHWNSITVDYTIKSALVFELINESYEIVISKLTKLQKAELETL